MVLHIFILHLTRLLVHIISSGSLIGDATGTITVNGGNQSYLKIRDASGGGS